MMKQTLLLGAALLTLNACTVGPDYQSPDDGAYESDWQSHVNGYASADSVLVKWWGIFEDPLLTSYIKTAAQHNKDVQIALANLRQARAFRQEEAGAFFPSIATSSQANRSKSGVTNNNAQVRNLYDAGFDASWEIDIFGGVRRNVEAADARLESALASQQDVLLSTLSEVARNYYEARGLQKRIQITKDNVDLQRQTFELIQARLDVGEASEFDLSRARGQYELTYARLPNLQAQLQSTIYGLSVLLGQPPEALLNEMTDVKPLPTPPDVVPVGLRSDLLRRRPDIRMAERELAASVADIGVETSELFPKFFLTGDIGAQARVFGDLFQASNGVWSLASLMQWSLFEGGALRARIEGAKAESAAALHFYEKTVLESLSDAESALITYGQELETRKRLEAGVKSRRESVRLAQELFEAGEEDFLAVLDAERELIASEDDLVTSETRAITSLVALFTSLGGGWEAFPTQESSENE